MENSNFSINANTCTLINQSEKESILGFKNYCVPVYQRPYSWKYDQVNRFVKSIVKAFKKNEAYFLGTVQIMPPTEKEISRHNIVDGQQRLTTLLLMFKTFSLYWEMATIPREIASWDWIITKVNKGKQQEYLEEVLGLTKITAEVEDETNLNVYLRNIRWIKELFSELTSKDGLDEGVIEFELSKAFIDYCVSKLYFVVIETQASLSKTLDIFNTINTAGMALNGGDLFKIQMFDYLTRIKGAKDIVFDQIDELYASIDKANKDEDREICNIQSILNVYKTILIEQNKASRVLHTKGQNTFYQQLFEVLLLDEKHSGFDKSKFIDALDLETLERLVKTRVAWENVVWKCEDNRFRHRTNVFLIWWSRYSSFLELDYIYMYKFYAENFNKDNFDKFTELLTKFFLIQSIIFKKSVNAAKTFCYDLTRLILEGNSNESDVISFIEEKLRVIKKFSYSKLEGQLNANDIFDVRRKKDLLTRISAMLEEEEGLDNPENPRKYFWGVSLDIEHIYPRNPAVVPIEEWNEVLNTIGNLVVLERTINQSIQNKPFDKKILRYPKSDFSIVNKMVVDYKNKAWTVEECKKRKNAEVKKLMNYFFEDLN